MNISTQSRTPPVADPARLCAFNLGIQLLWGAILGLSLQARSIELAPANSVNAYATVAALGALVATIVQPIVGWLSDARRRHTGSRQAFYFLGIVIALPALGWFYFASTFAQLVVAFCLLELGMNLAIGPYQAVIPDYVTLDRRGVASSWMSGYQSLGNAAGLVIAGFIRAPGALVGAIAAPLVLSWLVTLVYLHGLDAANSQKPKDLPEAGGPKSPRSALGVLVVLLLSRGLINVGFFTLLGFLLFYVRDSLGFGGNTTLTNTGYLFLTFTLCGIVGALLSARPADRADKRLVVSVTCAVVAAALTFLATASSFALALAAAALAGAAWGGFVTADWALASAILPSGAMALSLGIWNVATTLPQVVAPALTGPIVTRFNSQSLGLGPRVAIVLSIVEFLAGGALIWRLPRA